MSRASKLLGLLCASAVLLPSVVPAIPQGITLSGYLTDAQGQPLMGAFPAQVRVYSENNTDNLIATFDSQISTFNGSFGVTVMLTGDILLMDEIWYKFAIDLDQNGIDEGDYFDEMYQINSVPFSLSGKPVTFFETHGGQSANTFGSVIPNNPAHTVWVVPFSTPPGGVSFNRLSCRIAGAHEPSNFMVGIYDSDGQLVYSSPLTASVAGKALHAWEIDGALEPSKIYYSALWSDTWVLSIPVNTNAPSVPTSGSLPLGGNEQGLLSTLAFDNINPDVRYYPISLGLYRVDETSPAKMKKHDGTGIDHKKMKVQQTVLLETKE